MISRPVQLIFVAISLSLIFGQAKGEKKISQELIARDIFQVSQINCYKIEEAYTRLNAYLAKETSSTDPRINFDIALDGLLEDLKKGRHDDAAAKRLFLSLSTIRGNLGCNSLSHAIIGGNYCAGIGRVGLIRANEALRRVDKVAWPLLFEHAEKCRETYKNRYFELVPKLNRSLLDRVESFLDKIIKEAMSRESVAHLSDSTAEKLQKIIFGKEFAHGFEIDEFYVDDYLTEAATEESDRQALELIRDKQSGKTFIDKVKFSKLYYKFIEEPCAYYVQELGPEIFEPAYFDELLSQPVLDGRSEEYSKAWVKYEFCSYHDNSLMGEAYGVRLRRGLSQRGFSKV